MISQLNYQDIDWSQINSLTPDQLSFLIQFALDIFALSGLTPIEINNGLCHDFALAVSELVPNAENLLVIDVGDLDLLDDLPNHTWLELDCGDKALHFDAECINGVESHADLPIFNDLSNSARKLSYGF